MHEFAKELRLLETSDGLKIALENLMRISVPEGVYYEVSLEGEEQHLPDYVRDQLYMVLRKGCATRRPTPVPTGSRSKSGSPEAHVTARVRDHGTGLDAEDGTTEGLGLSSMKERVSLLEGSFGLVPEPSGARGQRSACP